MRNLSQMFRLAEHFTREHSPVILTGIGVAGVLSTAILTGKATVLATRIVDDIQEQRDREDRANDILETPVPFKEKAQATWRLYIPPLSVAVLSATAIISANRIGTRRAAAMAAAYTIAERSFEEYRDKVVEKIGKNKEREVRDEVAQDRVKNHPAPTGAAEIKLLNPDDCRVHDLFSDRWFQSSMQKILSAQNKLNYQMNNQDDASLNEFYSMIGLGPVKYGDKLGWTAMEKLEIITTAALDEFDRPCMVISFLDDPKVGYSSTHG